MSAGSSKRAGLTPGAPASLKAVELYTVSGARPNPGPASIGVLLLDPLGTELESLCEEIGYHTNNAAEYRAVIRGLKVCASYTAGAVRVLSSSKLVARQLSGRYRIKNPDLKALYEAAKALEKQFRKVTYHYFPAEKGDQRR